MLNSGGVAEKPGGGVLSLNIAWMYVCMYTYKVMAMGAQLPVSDLGMQYTISITTIGCSKYSM